MKPKLLTTIPEYSPKLFLGDLSAGITVALVAIPLSIAIAIASGAPPEAGLVTAIVAGFLISALGGSRVQIGGPTGAFIVVVYSVIAEHGYDGLVLATLMAGAILVVAGLLRARARGIRVIGATILPFGTSTTYHPPAETEADRQAINAWIRSPGTFDAVIDFDATLRDPAEPSRLNPALDSGDGLHPSLDGYRAMAAAVPLELLRQADAR